MHSLLRHLLPLVSDTVVVICTDFNNRSNPQAGGACDMELGAVAMPSVYAKLQEIGKFILGNV